MSSNLFLSDALAAVINDAAKAQFNSGVIKVYDGTQPTDPSVAVTTQNLLATFTFASTAFGSSASTGTTPTRSSVATAASISDVDAVYTSTATWFRAFKSDGTSILIDGNVGTSGCDLNMTDTSLTSGEACSVESLTLATPQ